MFRRTALIVTLSVGVAAVAFFPGCSVHGEAKFGSDKKEDPPPPPPPKPDPKPDATPPKEDPPKTDPGGAELKGGKIEVPGNIVFDFGKATLKEGAGSEKVLEELSKFLKSNDKITELRIEGHTDNVGKPAENEELSGQRALTIKKWLSDHGTDEKRLMAVGCGETKPIASNVSEDGRAQNRRTEFKIATLRGKPWMGMDPTGGCKVFK